MVLGARNEARIVTLVGSDTVECKVDEAVIKSWSTEKMIKNDDGSMINFSSITGGILEEVIKFCKKHLKPAKTDDLQGWDAQFVKDNNTRLGDLNDAANSLKIKGLQDLTKVKTSKEKRRTSKRKTCNTKGRGGSSKVHLSDD